MTRAIITCMHAYTPFGKEFYRPLLDHFLKQLQKYSNEFDHLYIIQDDNWSMPARPEGIKFPITHVTVDSSLRYYDAYKKVLPSIKEDLVLFMDDDMVVYKPDIINQSFTILESDAGLRNELPRDVVSITDTIGTMKVPLKTGNKLCPYFFATRKELLMKYLDVDWGPDAMPYTETFGLLTEAMLKDGCKVYEMEDDKTEVNWIEGKGGIKTDKDLGYYHVRAGSTVAMLLATKHYGNIDTYNDYLKNQPKEEILRHCAWYRYMGGNPTEIINDL